MSDSSVPAQRQLQNWLEGKPVRHPVHPALVHLPIGLFVLSLLFDLASWFTGPANWLVRGAFYTILFGIGTAFLAAIAGLADWLDIRLDHPAKRVATTHMVLNLGIVTLYVISAAARVFFLQAESTPVWLGLLSLFSVGVLMYSGYLGGRLIYEYGIAVGRHRRHEGTPERTLRAEGPERTEEFVPVAYASRLERNQTLRAEVNGYVMTIVNLDGDYYAFQEFCTHRYGPLSEGSFHNGQVECPWHRSCFDVRTGQVTQGPAKVDLKTFEVRVIEDVLHVRVPAEPPPRAAELQEAAERGR